MAKGTMKTDGGRRPYGTGRPVCGRLFCKACGRWRLLLDFPAEKKTARGVVVRWASECRTCLARRQKRNLQDPAKREMRREYDRIWQEGKRRRQGIPARQWIHPRGDVTVSSHREVVDAGPLISYVERRLQTEDNIGRRGWQHVARRAKMDPRSLFEIRRTGRVHIAVADRILVALNGPHLAEMYPPSD